jgi:hypothetical protein
MTSYTCRACHAPATVAQGRVLRTCACLAPIIAHLKAVASGAGSANPSA